ncbi:MAG: hypothetical protein ACFFA0_11690 [Promethearchaeota archaeon]
MIDKLDKIERLSRQILSEYNLTSTQLYLFNKIEKKYLKDSINRIFGPPIGITDETWPKYDKMSNLELKEWDGDTRMDHIFTLDLKDLDIYNPDKARAMALFISDSQYHNAWVPFNDEVKILFLAEEIVNRGEFQGKLPKKQPENTSSFEIIPIKVPEEIFRLEELEFESIDEKLFQLLDELSSLIHNSPHAGGQPIWIQDMEWNPKRDFLLAQFDENFIDVYTRYGMMYIFATNQWVEYNLNGKRYSPTAFCQFT